MSEDAKAAKKRRLAQALRANLRRRKAAGTPADGEAQAVAARASAERGRDPHGTGDED